jgi:hypothetical protein
MNLVIYHILNQTSLFPSDSMVSSEVSSGCSASHSTDSESNGSGNNATNSGSYARRDTSVDQGWEVVLPTAESLAKLWPGIWHRICNDSDKEKGDQTKEEFHFY